MSKKTYMTSLLVVTLVLTITSGLIEQHVGRTIGVVSAAAPAISLSPTSGRSWLRDATLWGTAGSYSGATTVTVTGTGFPAEQDDISLRMAESDEEITTTAGNQLTLVRYSISAATSGRVKAEASGSWKATFDVPQTKAGTYNIFAVYTPEGQPETTSPPASFTVTAGIVVLEEQTQTAFGVFNSKVHILLSSFEGGETVSIMPTDFLVTSAFGSTAVSSFVVGDDPTWGGGSTYGTGFTAGANVGYVTSRNGSDIKVFVSGQTSGIALSAIFTLKPTIAVKASKFTALTISSTDPTISIARAAPTIWISGRNWGSDVTILANTIKLQISGVNHATQHAAVTTSANGAFDNVSVQCYDDLPTLPVTVIVNDISFNLESGNLIAPSVLLTAQQGVTKPLELTVPVAGALVASDPTRPDFLQLSGTAITHNAGGARTLVYVYAINGAPSTSWGVSWDAASGSDVALLGITTTDARGAGIAFISHAAGAIPGGTTSTKWKRDDHDLYGTGAMSDAGSITITVNPYVPSARSTPAWDFDTRVYRQQFTVTGYGFEPGEALTVSIDGSSWFSISGSDISNGGYFSVTTDPVKKMAYGDHLVTFSGSTAENTFSRTIKSRPGVLRDAASGGEPLTVNTALPGDPVVLRSSTLVGVFGLKASTAYIVKVGGVTVEAFVSTSDGTIPGSISFLAPALVGGLYVVDIVNSTGASAIFPCKYSGDQFKSRNANSVTTTGEGDGLRLTISLKIDVFPPSVSPGGNVTLSGTGLQPSTAYSVSLSSSASTSALAGPYVGFVLATFTTTSGGALPSGVKVTIPDVSTTTETGTTWYLHASTDDELADLESSGCGPVIVQASLTLTPTSGPTGSRVDFVGRGLASGATYTIRFGYVDVDHTGTGVGSLVADNYGRGAGYFSVPLNPAGNYNIQLKRGTSYDILNIMPTFTIEGAVGMNPPLVKLSGEFDYSLRETVRIKLVALVRDGTTMDPASDADVTIQIYDDNNNLWKSSIMVEKLAGIYEWTSTSTIKDLRLEKGIYLVRVQASYKGGPKSHDILLFHIDPPAEGTNEELYYIALTAVISVVATTLVLKRR